MKVYVVMEEYAYEGSSLLIVCSSKAKARKYVKDHICGLELSITEYEVDNEKFTGFSESLYPKDIKNESIRKKQRRRKS